MSRFLLVLVGSIIPVIVLEIAGRLIESFNGGKEAHIINDPYDYSFYDPPFGWRIKKNTKVRSVKWNPDGSICYDAVYITDDRARRVAPNKNPVPGKTKLLFFGDSILFGQGLNVTDTLQYHLSDTYDVTNFSMIGWGPQHMLALLQAGNVRPEDCKGNSIAVYKLGEDHVQRAAGDPNTPWTFHGPRYVLKNSTSDNWTNETTYIGSFEVTPDLRYGIMQFLIWLHDNSALARLLNLKSLWPSESEEAFRLTAALLSDSKRSLEKMCPGIKFKVIYSRSRPSEELLENEMRSRGLEWFDISDNDYQGEVHIGGKCDWHPNAEYIKWYSERLRGHLDKLQGKNSP